MKNLIATIFILTLSLFARDIYTFNDIRIGSNNVIYDASSREPLNGIVIISMSGEPIKEMVVENGYKVAVEAYYDTGEPFSYATYRNEKKNGVAVEHYRDGTISVKTTYKNGKRDGVHTEYNEDGSISVEMEYKNGKRDGYRREYRENYLWAEEHYENGKLDGEMKLYYKSGKTKVLANIKGGVFTSGMVYDSESSGGRSINNERFRKIFFEY